MTVTGSCLCGKVRYEVAGELLFSGNCHCSRCRKSHGAAYATWGIINPDQFRWTAGEDSLSAYESSPRRFRCFCRHCGSPLASRHNENVEEIVLATVDGDPGSRPREHIFVASKAPWHDITDTLPQHAAWPGYMQPAGNDALPASPSSAPAKLPATSATSRSVN